MKSDSAERLVMSYVADGVAERSIGICDILVLRSCCWALVLRPNPSLRWNSAAVLAFTEARSTVLVLSEIGNIPVGLLRICKARLIPSLHIHPGPRPHLVAPDLKAKTSCTIWLA